MPLLNLTAVQVDPRQQQRDTTEAARASKPSRSKREGATQSPTCVYLLVSTTVLVCDIGNSDGGGTGSEFAGGLAEGRGRAQRKAMPVSPRRLRRAGDRECGPASEAAALKLPTASWLQIIHAAGDRGGAARLWFKLSRCRRRTRSCSSSSSSSSSSSIYSGKILPYMYEIDDMLMSRRRVSPVD